MPRATTSISDTEKFDLKSCPGGYVVLRRMTYGQYLTRREMMSQMAMKQSSNRGDMEAMINAMNKAVVEYEFQKCVVEHNLENEEGQLLDFIRNAAVTFELLDPRIGDEIATRIGQMNNFEEDLKNSPSESSAPSSTGDSQVATTSS